MAKPIESSSTDFFYKLPKSRQHIVALAIIFVIPFVLFFDITLGGKELQRHDITQYRAAVESVYEYQEEYGENAYWSTNMFGGMPSYVIRIEKATPHLDWFHRYFKMIYPAFPFWVMMGGMYFLLILMGFRPLTACLGSLMYGLTSYFTIIIVAGHTSKFLALSYIPWIFSGYWLIVKKEKKLVGLLLLMVAMTLEVRAGHPQITYYFMFLLGFLWIFDSWPMIKESKYKPWAIMTGLLLIGGVIGVMGSTEKYLALQEYAQYSLRGGSDIKGTTTMDTSYAFGWSQGISETLTLLMPNLFGGASPDYWGPKTFTSGPHYLGISLFLFFLISLFKVKDKIIYVFLSAGILAILFSWGGNFLLVNQFAFDYIPLFDKFRAPETWLVLTIFSFSIVSLYGLEWFLNFVQEKGASIKSLYAPIGTCLVILISLFLYTNSMDFIKDGEIDRVAYQIAQQNQVTPDNPQVRQQSLSYINTRLVPAREEKAKADALRMFLFFGVTGALVFLITTKKVSAGVGGFALIAVFMMDTVNVNTRYIDDSKFVSSNIDPTSYVESQRRDLDQYIEENISAGVEYSYRVFPLLDNPFGNATPAYFYPILGGYTAAKLSTFQDVFMTDNNPVFAGPTGLNIELLAMLNTKYLTYNQPLGIPGLTPVFQSQFGVVNEVVDVLPKAFFVDSTVTVESPKEAYDLLFPGQVDFKSTAIVENFDPITSSDSTSSAEVTFYTGQEMTIELSRSKPGFLVISEMYYPEGWIALLNGEKVQIHKTNYMVRGIQIPEGNHTLILDFQPQSITLGNSLSWFSLSIQLILSLLLGVSYFRTRNEQTA